ncbi:MAG: transcriptional repressor LexA [Roseimicrobium sp.]
MLTDRQHQLVAFLRSYQRSHGVMPSTRDIQQHFGFASQTAAMSHLKALERKGAIRRLAGKARAVVFPEDMERETCEVPVFGVIPAGFAADNPELADGKLHLDLAALGLSMQAKPFALRVRGDSMIGAHIVEGDYVILEQREPKSRDIVAALLDGESTLKRYVVEKGKPFLRAENPAYPDLIPARELTIQGVMVGLLRPRTVGELTT